MTPLAILIERCDQVHANVGRSYIPDGSPEWEYVIWWVEAHADTSVSNP